MHMDGSGVLYWINMDHHIFLSCVQIMSSYCVAFRAVSPGNVDHNTEVFHILNMNFE